MGLKQMEKRSGKVKIGILITDGIHTTKDAVTTARKYPTLDVLGVPGAKGKIIRIENCKRMDEAGKGKFLLKK